MGYLQEHPEMEQVTMICFDDDTKSVYLKALEQYKQEQATQE